MKGIYLDLGMMNMGMGAMKEVRDKLIEFREESGKPVVAYADWYTQGTYYLASAADEVYLQPQGDLDFRGLRSEYMFFKGMFDKLDIDIQFIRGSNNQFKSFGEAFTEEGMSEANREQNRYCSAASGAPTSPPSRGGPPGGHGAAGRHRRGDAHPEGRGRRDAGPRGRREVPRRGAGPDEGAHGRGYGR